MRRLALAGLALAIAAGVAAGAFARDRASAAGPVACGSAKQFTYLFWPQGHPAIPSVNFPAFPVPHMEIYTGSDPTFPNSASAGFLSAQGGGFAKSCKAARQGRAAPIQRRKTSTQTGRLTCTFPRSPLQTISKAGGGSVLTTVEPAKPGTTGKPQVEVTATIKDTGSTLVYDGKYCKLGPAPKPPPLMQFSFQGIVTSFNGNGPMFVLTYSGTRCGSDVLGPWSIKSEFTGGNVTGPPITVTRDLTSGSGTFTIISGSDGSAQAQLQASAGPPPTMTLNVTLTGSWSGLSTNPSQVPITATPVASC